MMNHDDSCTLSLMEKYPKLKKTTKVNSIKSRVAPISKISPKVRKRTSSKSLKKHSFLVKLGFGLILCTLLFYGGKYLYDHTINYNPLLGKWRTQTVMGIMEISFDRDSASSFGMQKAVSYDVKENEVIVMDEEIKMGERYRIIDDNTITVQSGTSKMTFKRVK